MTNPTSSTTTRKVQQLRLSGRSIAIVIPAYRELVSIEKTFQSLDASHSAAGSNENRVSVVVVVNQPQIADVETEAENKATVSMLKKLNLPYPLHVLDRTVRNGVGEARKIGMEYAISSILSDKHDLLVSLDADCEVSKNYISALLDRPFGSAALTLGFEHRTDDLRLKPAIEFYDGYLRYMQRMLEWAGSPYAFFTIGSCMATDVHHYQACRGMPAKNATEDFHFLNKLRKLGPIDYWPDVNVFPAVRPSTRVYLGTGFFLQSYLENPEEARTKLLIPSEEAFARLKESLFQLENEMPITDALTRDFFAAHSLDSKLQKMKQNSRGSESYRKKLIHLFDGMMTYRLLKFYERSGLKSSKSEANSQKK
jgi:hypothetical protein